MNEQVEYPHYSVTLEWDDVDHIYVVTLPEFRGCHTHGESLEEAVRNAREVIEMLVDDARAHGKPLPAPRHFKLEEEPVAATA